ncbi:MAG: hypothetical protein QFB87_03965 [Patescibacteria group bacterium]|nr:hypothetical protein [Patescibacteria group bacterium]
MIRLLLTKVKPTAGFAHILHLLLLVTLPAVVFVLVRLQFVQLALIMVILSKWRMFAVRPRFWTANIRANAIDIIVGLSIVLFMSHSATSVVAQLIWAVLYGVWLIVIKPRSSLLFTSLQAAIGQLCGLMALYLTWAAGPLVGIVFVTGLICFLAARHFFDSFNEPYARLLSYLWGYFGAALAWLMGHWLLFYVYQIIAQPTLLLSVLGYGLAVLYYLDHHGRLNKGLQRQFVFLMLAVVLVVLTFSDWGDKAV